MGGVGTFRRTPRAAALRVKDRKRLYNNLSIQRDDNLKRFSYNMSAR